MRTLIQSLLSLSVVALLACGQNAPVDPTGPNTPVPDEQAPEFEGGGQQAPVGAQVYPGPYGIGVGSVIPNYTFYGYPRASLAKGELTPVTLSDFYNPTGEDVYPDNSPYGAGTKKPKALVLDRSAVWCGPCVHEATNVIPPMRQKYEGNGGEFFVTLDDGPKAGTRATAADLLQWVNRFNINYPAVIDPNATLSAIVGYDAYPGNVIIRTKDMKIVHWEAGVPQAAFWSKFEAVLNGEPMLPGDQ